MFSSLLFHFPQRLWQAINTNNLVARVSILVYIANQQLFVRSCSLNAFRFSSTKCAPFKTALSNKHYRKTVCNVIRFCWAKLEIKLLLNHIINNRWVKQFIFVTRIVKCRNKKMIHFFKWFLYMWPNRLLVQNNVIIKL